METGGKLYRQTENLFKAWPQARHKHSVAREWWRCLTAVPERERSTRLCALYLNLCNSLYNAYIQLRVPIAYAWPYNIMRNDGVHNYANYCWLSSTGKGVVVVVTVVDAVMLFCLFSAMHFVLKVVAFVEKLCERGSPDSASKSRRSKVASKWSPGCVGKKSMWAYLRMEIQSKLAINPARGVVAPTFPYTSEILVSRIPRGHACRDYPQYSLRARALRQWRRRADPPGCLAGFPPLWRHRSPGGVDHLSLWSHLYRTLWRFSLTLKAVYWIISVMELCNFRL